MSAPDPAEPGAHPGLSPERTELAWRRTVLSLAVGALVALRLLPPVMGRWSSGVGFTGLALTAGVWVLAGHRARQTDRALLDASRQPLPGGGLLLLLTVACSSGAFVLVLYALSV